MNRAGTWGVESGGVTHSTGQDESVSDDIAHTDVAGQAHKRLRLLWVWPALGLLAIVVVAVSVLAATRTSETSRSYVCADAGGPIFDVATPDEAFELWWQSVGPPSAAQMTQAFPAMSVEPAARKDFVRSIGSAGTVGWAWEFADGEQVSVSASRVTSANGWMVAANRCSF